MSWGLVSTPFSKSALGRQLLTTFVTILSYRHWCLHRMTDFIHDFGILFLADSKQLQMTSKDRFTEKEKWHVSQSLPLCHAIEFISDHVLCRQLDIWSSCLFILLSPKEKYTYCTLHYLYNLHPWEMVNEMLLCYFAIMSCYQNAAKDIYNP